MTGLHAVRPRAILLARLSDNREDVDLTDEGIPRSLEDQVQRMRHRADELGWDVYKVIKNPRLSAYKRRKLTLPDGRRESRVYRPDLREALDLLWAGRTQPEGIRTTMSVLGTAVAIADRVSRSSRPRRRSSPTARADCWQA